MAMRCTGEALVHCPLRKLSGVLLVVLIVLMWLPYFLGIYLKKMKRITLNVYLLI